MGNSARTTEKLSILLATEDDSLIQRLEEGPFTLRTVTDGFEVVQTAVETQPDAIILDESLEKPSPPTLALWLKLNPATIHIPIIGVNDSSPIKDVSHFDAFVSVENIKKDLEEILTNFKSTLPEPAETLQYEEEQIDPLSIASDLIEVYRERIRLANKIIEILVSQHDFACFEHTIRQTLETVAKATKSPMISLITLDSFTQYTYVNTRALTTSHLKAVEEETVQMAQKQLGLLIPIQQKLVFGRRWLIESDIPGLYCRLTGYPVKRGRRVLGYLSSIHPPENSLSVWSQALLPHLTEQVALLLLNAELIHDKERHVTELWNILRAALETSGIPPACGENLHKSLLQYLLIILELCSTETGIVAAFNESGTDIAEIAALGCEYETILGSKLVDGRTLRETFLSLRFDDFLSCPGLATYNGVSVIIPLSAGERTLGAAAIINLPSHPNFRMVQALKTLAGMGGYYICNEALYKQAVKNSVLERELNIAREIQREMLPQAQPSLPGYDIYGEWRPAKQVGGDLFDYFNLKDGSLLITIADVSGKGVPAGLLMTMTRAFIIAGSEYTITPDEILKSVNQHLVNKISTTQFVTASLLTLNKNSIWFASAGHLPLLIYRASTDKVEEISPEGVAMGIVDNVSFGKVPISIEPGDILLLYTDGLNEAMNPNREQFGYERIKEVIRNCAHLDAKSIVDALFKAVEAHSANSEQFDDTTIIAIKKTKEGMEK